MTPKHTPGPWRTAQFINADSLEIVTEAKDEQGFPVETIAKVWRSRLDLSQHPRHDANAHLIASAPDLLRALEDLLTFLDQYPHRYAEDIRPYTNEARQAIQKATQAETP